ncbi:MAG: 4-hydroxy-3-methylbut-2-enyl diphosphate reductase [Deltaproteobacteria bacterium]|nr:4-hydroxy-3-methylbut-2-enyl diphosphate reductase [Deltaproteobacteria bacterium]
MKIKLAKTSGFCMGVRRAMEMILEALNRREGPIYSYGPLIHNSQVLEMLENKGLMILEPGTDSLAEVNGGSVIIRAHGIPPGEAKALEAAGLSIIDATCPRVIRVQTIIHKQAQMGYTPIIVGDADHPEVIGLLGYADGKGHAVKSKAEVETLPDFDKVIVVAQTTQTKRLFEKVVEAVKARWPEALIFTTICGATHRRQEEVRRLAHEVQAMVVVGGHNSGNTARLAEVSQAEGLKTIHLETEDELDPGWLANVDTVGIAAGASTPNWMIKRVVRELERVASSRELSLRNISRRILRVLLLSNIYVALGAGSLCMAGALLQGLSVSLELFAVTFFYVHAMHMLNLFLDKEAGKYNDPDRILFLESHKILLIGLGMFSGLICLVLGFKISLGVFILFMVTGAVSFLYPIRIMPRFLGSYTRVTKLKDIPASKTLSVSAGWALSLSLIPALAPGGAVTWSTVLVAVVIFLLVFIRSSLGGIFDIQGDRIVGQETIPIIVGEERTLSLLTVTNGLLIVVLVGGWLLEFMPSLALFLLALPAYAAFYLALYQRERLVIGTFFEALVDADFLLAGLVSWVWWLTG